MPTSAGCVWRGCGSAALCALARPCSMHAHVKSRPGTWRHGIVRSAPEGRARRPQAASLSAAAMRSTSMPWATWSCWACSPGTCRPLHTGTLPQPSAQEPQQGRARCLAPGGHAGPAAAATHQGCCRSSGVCARGIQPPRAAAGSCCRACCRLHATRRLSAANIASRPAHIKAAHDLPSRAHTPCIRRAFLLSRTRLTAASPSTFAAAQPVSAGLACQGAQLLSSRCARRSRPVLPSRLPTAVNVTTFCSATTTAALSGRSVGGGNTSLASLTIALKNTGDVSIQVRCQPAVLQHERRSGTGWLVAVRPSLPASLAEPPLCHWGLWRASAVPSCSLVTHSLAAASLAAQPCGQSGPALREGLHPCSCTRGLASAAARPAQVPYNVSVVSPSYVSVEQVFGLFAPTFDNPTGTATATAANYWDLLWPQGTNSVSLGMVLASLTSSFQPQQARPWRDLRSGASSRAESWHAGWARVPGPGCWHGPRW